LGVLVALLPVAAIVISMSVLNLRAAPACGLGLLLSVILGISGSALQASSVIPILSRGLLSSWDLVFLTIGGSLMGAVLTANGTTGVLSTVLSSHHTARLLLAGTCLGVIPAVSALIGPGAYFVGIPLLMSLGIPAQRAIPVFFLSQTWGLPAFTFGLPCIGMAASAGVPAQVIANRSSAFTVILIAVGAVMLRVIAPELKTVRLTQYSAIALAAMAGAVLGCFLGPAFPTLIGGTASTVASFLLEKDRSMYGRLREISFVKVLPVLIVVAHSILIRIPSVSSVLGRLAPSVSTTAGTVTFDFLNSSGFMLLVASLMGCLSLRRDTARKCLGTAFRSWDAIVVAPIAISLAGVMGAAGMLTKVVEATTSLGRTAFSLSMPLIGMLGQYVTGSLVSGSLVVGGYIAGVASSLGIDPGLAAAATLVGGAPIVILVPSKTALACAAAQYGGEQRSIIRRGLSVVAASFVAMAVGAAFLV
jgi:L-lactate permease